MRRQRSFTARLMQALALLLLTYGLLVALLGRSVARQYEHETLQRLSHGLARHIVEHWPEITLPPAAAASGALNGREQAERAAREALLQMLMVVNPGVQVYVLDADGRVDAYIGEPGMVRQPQVDLGAVRAFLGGAALPLRGTDPMAAPGADTPRIFSAAMFAPRPDDTRPPGYLYVVLDGAARETVAALTSDLRSWQGVAIMAAVALLGTLVLGLFALRRLTLPLRRLAQRMHQYSQDGSVQAPAIADEVQAIAAAFDATTQRIEAQTQREQRLAEAHRETMASVAHDLRTPLTALHGQLEALAQGGAVAVAQRSRVLSAALAQSDKVRRLSQQLFELAALQSNSQVLHRERFNLDELVADAVQKFESAAGLPAVTLSGAPPGRVELDGDLQLIERALANLIDNAMRHAGASQPVRVSLRREGLQALVWVEDAGPGLPAELVQRLERGQSLRDPPPRRAGGGIGGLGLAIAQRVAVLHGGSLRPLASPEGGTRLCLALPVAPA